MITIQKPIVDMIEDVVKATELVILPYLKTVNPLIQQLHYEHGHPLEISNTLVNMNQPQINQYKKYPLICLLQDFPEAIGAENQFYSSPTLHVLIVNSTNNQYNADQRYEKNFKPILYPIYHEFLKQLGRNRDINVGYQIQHTKYDRLYWGREGVFGNNKTKYFEDWLDAIEIQSLKVSVRKTQCTINTNNQIIN